MWFAVMLLAFTKENLTNTGASMEETLLETVMYHHCSSLWWSSAIKCNDSLNSRLFWTTQFIRTRLSACWKSWPIHSPIVPRTLAQHTCTSACVTLLWNFIEFMDISVCSSRVKKVRLNSCFAVIPCGLFRISLVFILRSPLKREESKTSVSFRIHACYLQRTPGQASTMAPVDWDEIVNANVDELEDDRAEKMYESLAEVTNAPK